MKLVLAILAVVISVSFQVKPPVYIIPGFEADGLKLSLYPVRAAINTYGENDKFSQGIACGYHTFYTNRFTFSNEGVTVISHTVDEADTKKASITNIGVSYPRNAQTREGVNIKDDTEKIIKVYGQPESADTSLSTIDLHYNSKGISFRCDKKKSSILTIEIYRPRQRADF